MLRLLVAPLAILLLAPAHADARPGRVSRHLVRHERGAAPSYPKARKPSFPAVALHHLSTGESFSLRPDASGHLGGKQLRGVRRFLRCHHTGREHAMSSRLLQLLYATARHFGDAAVEVVAGYRAPRVARKKGNPRSHHKQGLACDFRLTGVPLPALRDYLRSTWSRVGVGYYPRAGFVHLDVRDRRSAFWIDYSGPGESALYAADPEEELRAGRADEAFDVAAPAPTEVAATDGEVGAASGESPSPRAASAPAASPDETTIEGTIELPGAAEASSLVPVAVERALRAAAAE